MSRKFFAMTLAVVAMFGAPSFAQTQPAADTDVFGPENAIVDTSIPFAIGAREARQELRGAFGWATFQEGFVELTYFRFDPDGYARFSPTPRLDTDVFEVICRPGTLNCLGRKGTLSVYLNGQGALQLQLEEVGDGDTLYIVDGLNELPIPMSILGPLDARMENLLAQGGELVVRRGEIETARISLAGFNPVATYLRWITARQDYGVMPRGWPVPNSNTASANPIAVNWQLTTPTQQRQPVYDRSEQGLPVTSAPGTPAPISPAETVVNSPTLVPLPQTATAPQSSAVLPVATSNQDQLVALQTNIQALMQEIELLKREASTSAIPQSGALSIANQDENADLLAPRWDLAEPNTEMPHSDSDIPGGQNALEVQFDFLVNELGMDRATALQVLRSAPVAPTMEPAQTDTDVQSSEVPPLSQEDGDVVLEILAELAGASDPSGSGLHGSGFHGSASAEDYQLLTEYFKSVFVRE